MGAMVGAGASNPPTLVNSCYSLCIASYSQYKQSGDLICTLSSRKFILIQQQYMYTWWCKGAWLVIKGIASGSNWVSIISFPSCTVCLVFAYSQQSTWNVRNTIFSWIMATVARVYCMCCIFYWFAAKDDNYDHRYSVQTPDQASWSFFPIYVYNVSSRL